MRAFQRFGQAEVVRAKILGINGDKIDVSLRPSALAEGKDALALPSLPQEGSIAQGFVVNVGKKGCFVRLSHSITARVFLKELADTFIKDPSQSFPVGKLVAGRILAVVRYLPLALVSLSPHSGASQSHMMHPDYQGQSSAQPLAAEDTIPIF